MTLQGAETSISEIFNVRRSTELVEADTQLVNGRTLEIIDDSLAVNRLIFNIDRRHFLGGDMVRNTK
jgi:hypothetical protein